MSRTRLAFVLVAASALFGTSCGQIAREARLPTAEARPTATFTVLHEDGKPDMLAYEAPAITVTAKRIKATEAVTANAGVELYYEAPAITVSAKRMPQTERALW